MNDIVSYNMYNPDTNGGYIAFTEAHIYASCQQPTTCAPDQYTVNQLFNNAISFTITINTGACSTYWLIFYAEVSASTSY